MTESVESRLIVHDSRRCQLGEGPLWHPEREQLYWFDILGKRLLSRTESGELSWQFDEHVSAAGWINRDTLLIASETAMFTFDLNDGVRVSTVCELEADNGGTRSNDGRADPWGGFWIGTMGKCHEAAAGAIYRWHRGELRRLYADISVSNAICFSPDRACAYFTDTRDGRIMRQELEPKEGWPVGDPRVLIDVSRESFGADGMVVDSEGRLWNACWGDHRVACYAPNGVLELTVVFPTPQVSCPAFGGEDYRTLYVTTAATGLDDPDGHAGQTYGVEGVFGTVGLPEHRVDL